jgi:hypothetical protein
MTACARFWLVMDLNYARDTTSGQEGLEVIPKIQEIDNTLPIVVMTAWATALRDLQNPNWSSESAEMRPHFLECTS